VGFSLQCELELSYLMQKLRGLPPSQGVHLVKLLHLLEIPQLRQAQTILHLLIGLILLRICNQIQYGAKALLWKGVDAVVKHSCWLSTHLKQNLVLTMAN
jgi:hypothetical protein